MRGRSVSFRVVLSILPLCLASVLPAHAQGCDDDTVGGGGGIGGGGGPVNIQANGCGGGGGSQPDPICWLDATETVTDCDTAVSNDYCDVDPDAPFAAYLRDGVWTGNSCLGCMWEEAGCGTGLDTDCDGTVDCEDMDCMANGACTWQQWSYTCGGLLDGIDYGSYELDCFDGRDNEGDGHIDCLDADCIYGTECAPLGPADCNCPDRDGDGQRYQDWGDVALAFGGPDFAAAYRCAQIWAPYCIDPPTQTFLDWMRAENYAGRIIAIYAEDANDPNKRSLGEAATYQRYYNLRNNIPYPHTVQAFKESAVFEIEFIQLVPTDENIVANLIPEDEVDKVLLPFFQDQIWGRPIDFVYTEIPVNFHKTFGNPAPCQFLPGWVCFDMNAIVNWLAPQLAGRIYIGHQGAFRLIDGTPNGTPIGSSLIHQTFFEGHRIMGFGFSVISAHEFGHSLSLQHPIWNYDYDVTQNPRNMLGTGGIMTKMGYVDGTAYRTSPLERYALEPKGGYSDEGAFGPVYGAETLVCND